MYLLKDTEYHSSDKSGGKLWENYDFRTLNYLHLRT